jgi:peptidoglycan/LPS O-acetylase OafA/YrhL
MTLPIPTPALRTRLPGLDMLRGIAALCVVGLHTRAIYGDYGWIVGTGYLAVDLFFMLSGYVMARTYDPRFAAGLGPLRFFLARYRRLWPVMAIGSVIGLPKLWFELQNPTGFALTAGFNLLLLPVPQEGPAFPLNIPAWSILFELTANLIHGLILWRLRLRWLVVLAAATIPPIFWVGTSYDTFDVGAHTYDFLAGLPRVLLSYLIGIVLWKLWRDEPALPVPPGLALIAMPAMFSAAWILGLKDWRLDLVFIVIACPLLIAGGLRLRSRGAMTGATALALGALSFPLYAVHMPVLQGMHLLGYGQLGGAVAALAGGMIVALGVEAQARRRKRRRTQAA